MRERPAELSYKRSLFSIKSYIFYFLIITSAITCCLLLFLNHLELDYGSVRESAKLTAMNVLLISLIMTVLDGIYRKITLEYPMKRILKASQKLIAGDFSVRVPLAHDFDNTNELDVLIENFNRIAEELSGVETLRTDFVSNVSHEIKTPLSVIQNYASLLQNAELSEDKKEEYTEAIVDACRRLTGLITNILKLNKLENQHIFPESKEFDIDTQLSECIIRLDDVLERKDLEAEIDLEERVKVKSDRELLELVWTVIQNYASLLQNAELSEDKKEEYTEAIVDACRRLTGLITNILKLNKLENQHIFPESKEFDIDTQLSECIIRLDDVLERKDLEAEIDLEERVKVKSDRELLELVWNNLLSNAIKFTPPGGKITVSLKTDETMAVIKISDTGCGISSEVGKRIFEKFYQGDSSHATQGNGLGLALVKRVVDIVGGDISIESRLGEGSTFTVRLKRVLAEEPRQHLVPGK